MAYYEDTHETICGACGATNHVVVAYAGDYRANERETVACYQCDVQLEGDECWAIYSAATAAGALLKLRRTQNRA